MKLDLRHVFTNARGDAIKVGEAPNDYALTLRDAVFMAVETPLPQDGSMPLRSKMDLYRIRNKAVDAETDAEFTEDEAKLLLDRANAIFTIHVVGQLVELLAPDLLA